MSKIVTTMLSVAVFSALATGCTVTQTPVSNEPVSVAPADSYATEGLSETTVKLSDGREVVCLIINGYRESAVSCDWEGASSTK